LIAGSLCSHHGFGIERIADLNLAHAGNRSFQRTCRRWIPELERADGQCTLRFVEREESEAFQHFVEYSSSASITSAKKMLGDCTQLQGLRMIGRTRTAYDSSCGFAGKADFGNAGVASQGFPNLASGAVNYVQHAGWQQIAIRSASTSRLRGVLEAGLTSPQFPPRCAGCEFPRRPSTRGNSGDDLTTTPSGSLK